MLKTDKMFWIESILSAKEDYKKIMKDGKVSQQHYIQSLKEFPFYDSKELTIRCFKRKTKEELNNIYNQIRELIYKFE